MTDGGELIARAEVGAAGGIVHQTAGDGGVEVLCVHRPHYDDWSFPKGKLDEGESWQGAALREVKEETGLRCHLGPELPPVSYRDQQGRLKVVRYWLMVVEERGERDDGEVDEMRWLSLPDAAALLTYKRDRELLREVERVLAGSP